MKAIVTILMLGILVAGCASHGTWSRSDLGAWSTLDTKIARDDKAYYLEKWGEPLTRRNTYVNTGDDMGTVNGEEMLWLWKSDGTGPSDQPGQGWELFLEFNQQGTFRNWWVGTYRTTLTVADVVAATRKFEYRFGEDLMRQLGLSSEQHAIENKRFYCSRPPSRPDRKCEIIQLQNAVRVISAVTFEADTAARNLHDRLASESEVQALLESYRSRNLAANRTQRRLATPDSVTPQDSRLSSGGFLGRGFLGPYTPNAYGPGINSDATGRPFIWQPETAGPKVFDPFLQVQPNAYGPGVGMDQYGRPVRPACPPGWAGPC